MELLDYDLKIAFWAKEPEEFDYISHSIKTKFSKIIKDWQSFIFTKQYKFSKIIKDWQSFIFTKQYKWKELPF